MDSPFPGMDPYLEAYWRDIHQRLVIYAADQLQPRLPAELRARAEGRMVIGTPAEGVHAYVPDVTVFQRPRRGDVEADDGGVAVMVEPEIAVAAALQIPIERRIEGYVVITEPARENRIVTVIEFLSPTNKRPGPDRRDYLRKRDDCLRAGLNYVEVDLLRAGDREPMIDPAALPASHRTPYLVAVHRGYGAPMLELYAATLREPLPAIAVPLREADRDVPLQLQPIVTLAYRNGRYDDIDYRVEPVPPLDPEDATWADARLRDAGRRPKDAEKDERPAV